ncbi:ribonuclease BN [Halobacteriales archaeon Cl-PHB]
MSQADGPSDDGDADDGGTGDDPNRAGSDADGVSTVETRTVDPEDVAELRKDLEEFEDAVEDRTVHREDLESDLRQYVRRRQRRGHASGWGPYLVLLYGTAMTLGAFYFLDGGWAVLAMVVVWLSTLGLYTLMLLVGLTVTTLGLPGRLLDRVRDLR